MNFKLPEGFKLGVSSASTQIEGGDVNSNWNNWYELGKISDGSNPAVANMHWEKWKEDIDLMKDMGIKSYRFGIEWARLFPAEGVVDKEAVDHYRQEIQYMVDCGIQPLLTIHHFSNPMWFENKGGFENSNNLKYYLELVELTVRSYGDLVSDFVTINEPNIYAYNGWFFGAWPPGKKSMMLTGVVSSNLVYCHIKAYEMIHKIRTEMGYSDTKAGFANHVRAFNPKSKFSIYNQICSCASEYMFQDVITIAMCRGIFLPPLVNKWGIKPGEYSDFTGVNYYTRSTMDGLADGVKENSQVNDLGWEIYPFGIISCTKKLLKILNRPVWITENGTCDLNDSFRSRYIAEHLNAIATSDLPFERYYHWCFCDNFEWVEGESARFGIVHTDFRTQKRTIKQSGEFYTELINNNGMTEEMFSKYVKNQRFNSK